MRNGKDSMYSKSNKIKKYPRPQLTKGEKWCDGNLVTYPVSEMFNGGVIIDDEWYNGVEVPPPIVPEGYVLKSIGVGLERNHVPPLATALLTKKEKP